MRLLNAIMVGFALTLPTAIIAQTEFTRVQSGDLVTGQDHSWGVAWGDYNNDGWLDVHVANAFGDGNRLYVNQGDGTFATVPNDVFPDDGGDSVCGVWGDQDNDGDADLFVTNYDPPNDFFYRNDWTHSNLGFARVMEGSWVTDAGKGVGAAWADFDNDGWLDLYVANSSGQDDFLYRNTREGNMAFHECAVTTGGGDSNGCAWGDYDNDGDLDLFVANTHRQVNFLFRNDGVGVFSRILEGAIAVDLATSIGAAWGDYDNDGDLDLAVANGLNENQFLYRNNGDGSFLRLTEGPLVNSGGVSFGLAWGDYDNDGFLDLFVANNRGQSDFLFHSQKDGTFTRVLDGDIVNDTASGVGCAWGDYDNDGALDLIVVNGPEQPTSPGQPNFLYHNEGNDNAWLVLQLEGMASNRSAIGARVIVETTIWGQKVTQMREVSGGSGYVSQDDQRVHFGLGDAQSVDSVRIEWPGPSFTVQEFEDISPSQCWSVTEPPWLRADWSDGLELTIYGSPGLPVDVIVSLDLVEWAYLTTVIIPDDSTRATFRDVEAPSGERRFYRLASIRG